MEIKVGKVYRLGEKNQCFFDDGTEVVVLEIGVQSIVKDEFHPEWIEVGLAENPKKTQIVEDFELEEVEEV